MRVGKAVQPWPHGSGFTGSFIHSLIQPAAGEHWGPGVQMWAYRDGGGGDEGQVDKDQGAEPGWAEGWGEWGGRSGWLAAPPTLVPAPHSPAGPPSGPTVSAFWKNGPCHTGLPSPSGTQAGRAAGCIVASRQSHGARWGPHPSPLPAAQYPLVSLRLVSCVPSGGRLL